MGLFDRLRGRRQEEKAMPAMPEEGPGMMAAGMDGAMPVMPTMDRSMELEAAFQQAAAGNMEAEHPEAIMQGDAGMMAESMMMPGAEQPVTRIRAERQSTQIMNRERLNQATQILLKYKEGKASVNRRVIEAQNWWKLNNWEEQQKERGTRGASVKKSSTGWLWNCIVGKHADAMDSYPEPIILPRAEDDKEEAKKLSKIVPVVLEMNGFENVYSDAAWQKMQEGTAVYGVFWDAEKLNGLGDISIKKINILNLYWEPGIQDIQDSRNLFYVHYEDTDELIQAHPELEGEISNASRMSIDQYKTDDHINLDGKSLVIDWYYHRNEGGKKVLHYCQYVNESVIYSTEEQAAGGMYEGFYQHGMYPFVLDPLFPVAGSPAGYGYIDVAKDSQMDIDTLSQAMVKNMEASSTPRFFIRKDGSINEDEFADWSKPFIHSGGMLGEDSIRPVVVNSINSIALNMLQQKIDEIKFITGNTDVNNGGVPSGVTAASAIAALKEDSGRSSKDSTKAAYRSYGKIVNMTIELIRQFYDIPRQFRITGTDGDDEYTQYDNANIMPQPVANGGMAEEGMRLPVFDVEVRAQRENAYTKMSQNELAIQFYQLGAMNPQNTDQALMLLDMMDFRGKEEIRRKIQANGTIQDALMQVGQIAMALAEQYQPEVADQLAQTLQGVMMDTGMGGDAAAKPNEQTASGGDNIKPQDPNENKIVQRARERSANATRVT